MHRAGERAFHIAEELAFDQSRYQRTAIDRNKRLVSEGAGVMNGARHHFLPRAAFTQNEHRVYAVCRLCDYPVQLVHLSSAPNNAAENLLRLNFFAKHAIFRFEAQMDGDPVE